MRKESDIDQAIAEVKSQDLSRATDESKKLPGLYASLSTLDPNQFSKNRFGNEYERTLDEIKRIESLLPASMLSDLKMQQESGTGAFTPKTSLAPVTPTTFENTPMPMPSLIKEGDVSNFSTFSSGSMRSDDDYQTIKILGIDGFSFNN